MNRAAFISGVEGLSLLEHEKGFFSKSRPLGLILFARNIESEDQIKRLIGDVRDAVGAEDFWVLIDQEGGRVQRLRPPLFPNLPAARRYTELYKKDPTKADHHAAQAPQHTRLARRIQSFKHCGAGRNLRHARH